MIQIRVNNRFLDIRPDTSISFVYENAMFAADIPGDYTMPSQLAWTDNNLLALGNPDLVQGAGAFAQTYPAEVIFDETIRHDAVMNLINVDEMGGTISVNLFIGFGWLSQALRDKKITEYNYGQGVLSTVPKSQVYQYYTTLDDSTFIISFVINGRTISAPGSGLTALISLQNLATAINAISDLKVTASASDVSSPTRAKLLLVSTAAGCENAFTVDSTTSTTPLSTVTIIDEYSWTDGYGDDIQTAMSAAASGTYPTFAYTFFPIYNPGFYGKDAANNTDYLAHVNYFHAGQFFTNVAAGAFTGNFYTIAPQVYLATVLAKILSDANIVLKSVFLTSAEFRKETFYNLRSLDCTDFIDHFSADVNLFRSSFDIADCLPDLPVANFLMGLKVRFNLVFNYDYKSRVLEVEPFNTFYNRRDTIDRTDVTAPRPLIEPVPQDGIKLTTSLDSADTVPAAQDPAYLLDYTLAPGTKTLNVPFSTLYMYRGNDTRQTLLSVVRPWLVPWADQPGISVPYNQPGDSFPARTLKFLGRQNDGNGDSYPLATSGTIDWSGSQIADYALIWYGTKGLYNLYWKIYQESFWALTRKMTFVMVLSGTDLANLNRAYRQYIDGTTFFINKITVTARPRFLDAARVELYKM